MIQDIQSESSFYKASLKEVRRDYNYVSYDITLTLKENAPEGYLHDFIDIISNDPNPASQHCPVPVSGYIIPAVAVKPSPLSFGFIKAGKSMTKTVVLSGQSQFNITDFGTSDDRVTAKITEDQKSVHVIPVTITNTGKGGKINGTLAFRVSSQSNVINLPFSADLEQSAEVTPPAKEDVKPDVQKADDVPAVTTQKKPRTPTPAKPKELTPAEEYFPVNPATDSENVPAASEPSPEKKNAATIMEDKTPTTPETKDVEVASPSKDEVEKSAKDEKSDDVPVEEIELPPASDNY